MTGDAGEDAGAAVAAMSLAEVLAFLQGLREATFQDINRSYSRLMAIGLFEHGYSDRDRDMALGVADTIRAQILATLADEPEARAEFERAADMQIRQAKIDGIGSAEWIAEERRLGQQG